MLHKLHSMKREMLLQIQLSNLTAAEMDCWLAHNIPVYRMKNCQDVQDLSAILHAVTGGNVEELERTNSLFHSKSKRRWEWQTDDVHGNNGITIVANKLRLLPPKTRRAIITIAPYNRSSFNLDVSETATRHIANLESFSKANSFIFNDQVDLGSQPERAVLKGLLLNAICEKKCRFSHDRIEQAW